MDILYIFIWVQREEVPCRPTCFILNVVSVWSLSLPLVTTRDHIKIRHAHFDFLTNQIKLDLGQF